MPTIQIELNEQDHARLDEEYRKSMLALLQSDPTVAAMTFEQWLEQRLRTSTAPVRDQELQAIRAYGAVEKLVFAMHQHGFALVAVKKEHAQKLEQALKNLAQAVAKDLELQAQYVKRVQDLLSHFAKSAREAANEANVGLTSQMSAALTEAYRTLALRTEKALDTLGSERAIGRIEGAAAMLVGAELMDRATAKDQTDSFKIRVRTAAR